MKNIDRLKLPTPDEVKDVLIDDFCVPTCPDAKDYHCPDHECPVWKALGALDKPQKVEAEKDE